MTNVFNQAPELDEAYLEDTLFRVPELFAMIKTLVGEILGDNVFRPRYIFQWTHRILTQVLRTLMDLDKPFKYVVTCTIASKKAGTGTYSARECIWDAKNDNYLSVRWENKSIYTIVSVYGTGMFNIPGWPREGSRGLCEFIPRRLELKQTQLKETIEQHDVDVRKVRASRFRPSLVTEQIVKTKAIQMKKSRKFRDADLGANKYNCVDEEDVPVFEAADVAITQFKEILLNPSYYQQQEDLKAQRRAEEIAMAVAKRLEREAVLRAEAEQLAEQNKRSDSVQF